MLSRSLAGMIVVMVTGCFSSHERIVEKEKERPVVRERVIEKEAPSSTTIQVK